jgi:hypothetical protein
MPAEGGPFLFPMAGTVEALLQNVFFHKRGNKASHTSARGDGLSYGVRSDRHVDTPEDMKGAASQSNRLRVPCTAPRSPPRQGGQQGLLQRITP